MIAASARGRTIRRRATSEGTIILRIDHTYEIPSGVCAGSGAPLPAETGRGRIHLGHSNVRRVLRAAARCAGVPPVTVTSYRHWVDLRTTGGTFCAWRPVPADGRHLCGYVRLHATAAVSGITVTEDEVIRYAAARTDRGRFLPQAAPAAAMDEAPAVLAVDGGPLAAALPLTGP